MASVSKPEKILQLLRPPRLYDCRLRDDGQGEIDLVKGKIEEGGEAQAGLEADMQSKDADIKTLQASCSKDTQNTWFIKSVLTDAPMLCCMVQQQGTSVLTIPHTPEQWHVMTSS